MGRMRTAERLTPSASAPLGAAMAQMPVSTVWRVPLSSSSMRRARSGLPGFPISPLGPTTTVSAPRTKVP